MYISLKDSCANGFRKWADAHQPEMKNDLRASGSRLVSDGAWGPLTDAVTLARRTPTSKSASSSGDGEGGR